MSHRAPISSAPRPRSRRCVALATLALHALALAQQPIAQRISPNFNDTDITQIIEAVSMATGKYFISDPRVRGLVTMLSSTSMTPDQFHQVFLAILQVHGFVAVPAGDVIKIIPDANMRQYAADDMSEHVSSTSDKIVTRVLPVHNISASQPSPREYRAEHKDRPEMRSPALCSLINSEKSAIARSGISDTVPAD